MMIDSDSNNGRLGNHTCATTIILPLVPFCLFLVILSLEDLCVVKIVLLYQDLTVHFVTGKSV